MHWMLICLGAIPLLAYLVARKGRSSLVVSSAATSTPGPATPGRVARAFQALMVVLALPFLMRVAVTMATIVGLIYVLFFGPIKPIHEWLP
jgi:hypothetical protein